MTPSVPVLINSLSIVVTGSWDEDSSYASWTGVSSGTGLVLYGLIGSKDCHNRFDVRVCVSWFDGLVF